MKIRNLKLIAIVFGLFMIASCTGQKGDMTKDPKYADIANNIFITNGPLFYYHYTHSDGGKSGYFLSRESSVPNAELKAEIPAGSHVKISKVFEVPNKEGGVKAMVEGDVIPDGSKEGFKYMAVYNDIEPALKK
ncbi:MULTISPECIES: hypothetical protein [Sphingobacterium]|jgi:hypothetical protein|uniref:hypothetical protein n=1 Tax=Sphingobacterium TaxID=28453 RepID=UPI000C0BEBF4|nr:MULTISPECIES: hypothetical protein [Sphingobacterium]MCT1532845.1 hypothetical protein [Sphingobacterium daejeonense]